ncbi:MULTISPECIES: hypothetical protein [unclassified Pseudomonas]|jgi:hypothetical protein
MTPASFAENVPFCWFFEQKPYQSINTEKKYSPVRALWRLALAKKRHCKAA